MSLRALRLRRDRALASLHFARRRVSRASTKAEVAEAMDEIDAARAQLDAAEAAIAAAQAEVET